ncbi:MAG: hypothetical protein H0W87_02320 [Actinobacteria bacterium]|nr:hypothetical protein [Actinomycetota bacterium]
MSFFDKVKQGAADAAGTVKGNVQEMKIKNEMVRTYEELGRKAFELADKGKLKSTPLNPFIKHLRELKAELEASEHSDWAAKNQKS